MESLTLAYRDDHRTPLIVAIRERARRYYDLDVQVVKITGGDEYEAVLFQRRDHRTSRIPLRQGRQGQEDDNLLRAEHARNDVLMRAYVQSVLHALVWFSRRPGEALAAFSPDPMEFP